MVIGRVHRLTILGLLPLLFGCGGSGSSSGASPTMSVNIAWDAPTQDGDGGQLTDLAGFRIYEGSSPASYTMVQEVHASVTEFTLSLTPGTHYVVLTAYDNTLNESTLSNELALVVSDTGQVLTP